MRFGDRYADARIDLVDRESLAPGETSQAILTFAIEQPNESVLATLDLTEGGRKVGEATVTTESPLRNIMIEIITHPSVGLPVIQVAR